MTVISAIVADAVVVTGNSVVCLRCSVMAVSVVLILQDWLERKCLLE